jgi:two-component system alkaline phosphatase synthesis response regulator PhoP
MYKILLVDDEPDIVELIRYNLERENYSVIEAFDGKQALHQIRKNPDLILLDIMLPDINGFQVCTIIKEDEQFRDIPIIFLTALSSESDEIKGLNLGAVDYISKPISPQILSSRIKASLRSAKNDPGKESKTNIVINNIQIDTSAFKVFVDGNEVFFPRKEFKLLHFLATNRDKVFARETLLEFIWGEDTVVVDRTIDVHIRKIRQKLGSSANCIQTIKGIGYKFVSNTN